MVKIPALSEPVKIAYLLIYLKQCNRIVYMIKCFSIIDKYHHLKELFSSA